MKISTKSFISCALALGMTMSAGAVTDPTLAWGKLFDGTTAAGDNNTAIAIGTDNTVYWYNTLGSTDAARDLYFGGEKIFEGAPYTGTSNNGNFALTKTDAQGNALWTVYSNSGDFASSQGNLAVDEDGSIIFTAKVRHTDGHLDSPVTFVDATGTATQVGTAIEGSRYYFLILGKISADGELLWTRTIEPARTIGDDSLTDAVTTSSVVLAGGNIFIGGSFARELTFEKTGNTTATISSVSTADWTKSGTERDLYIAKFDTDGYFTAALTNTGNKMKTVNVLSIDADNDVLYVNGVITALSDGETTATLGDKTLNAGTFNSCFTTAVNPADLSVNWASSLTNAGVDGKGDYQNASINVVGDNVWIAAMGNGTFTCAEDQTKTFTTVTGNTREGFLIKYDRQGNLMGATTSRADYSTTGLTGYLNTFENPRLPGKVYVFGYTMTGAPSVFIRAYDAETLTSDESTAWNIITGGGVPTGQAAVFNSDEPAAYVAARGNKAFVPMGGEESAAPEKWAIYAARFNMPDSFLSSISSVATQPDLTVTGAHGMLTAASSQPCTVNVFDITGRLVASLNVNGTASVALPAGIYIAAGHKVAVR